MSMKIWIFTVSTKWNYCDGAVVIAAETWEACLEIWKQHILKDDAEHIAEGYPPMGVEGLYRSQADVPTKSYGMEDGKSPTDGSPSGLSGHGFVLSHCFTVKEKVKPGILVNNYNYA